MTCRKWGPEVTLSPRFFNFFNSPTLSEGRGKEKPVRQNLRSTAIRFGVGCHGHSKSLISHRFPFLERKGLKLIQEGCWQVIRGGGGFKFLLRPIRFKSHFSFLIHWDELDRRSRGSPRVSLCSGGRRRKGGKRERERERKDVGGWGAADEVRV
ncbi:hypothetical protein IE53DRAFT_51909 [Violaceomyces palustris]|uniref:Uncharacterized protein n=1 Tax=Violaceomyces palustris TaxID=1673888 RepID=A0ACD0P016_9BASI|nr:hypothetical protein IE53DRAFT_51909 [Violaceomyces palustris]